MMVVLLHEKITLVLESFFCLVMCTFYSFKWPWPLFVNFLSFLGILHFSVANFVFLALMDVVCKSDATVPTFPLHSYLASIFMSKNLFKSGLNTKERILKSLGWPLFVLYYQVFVARQKSKRIYSTSARSIFGDLEVDSSLRDID